MMPVFVLGIIFSFVIAIVYIAESEHTKRQQDKMEAELKREEMKRGYTPGTYSFRFEKTEDIDEVMVKGREALENGILAVKKRIGTMDSNN